MGTRLALALAVATAALVPSVAGADPLPAACVVVTPVQAQVGYAPTGPAGCIPIG